MSIKKMNNIYNSRNLNGFIAFLYGQIVLNIYNSRNLNGFIAPDKSEIDSLVSTIVEI